jgi:hypothetical protein
VTECFRCGDDDHLSYDCPSHTRPQPAPPADRASPAAVTYTPPPLPVLPPGTPPNGDWAEARQALGHQPGGEWLARACPWCEAGAWQPCVNRAIGRTRPPHDARMQEPEGVGAVA